MDPYFHPINAPGPSQNADIRPQQALPPQTSTFGAPPARSTSHSPPTGSTAAAGNVSFTATGSSMPPPRIRRRNRMIQSCLECRRRKLKCNKSHPCTNCVKFTRDCVFLAPALDQASQLRITEIKEKVGSLERLLERDVAKNAAATAQGHNQGPDNALPDDSQDALPANDDEKELEPTPLAVVDAAYDVDGEDDDRLDLGILMGKMRLSERIGGFFRPKISQELEFAIVGRDQENKTPSPMQPTKPLPPSSEWLNPTAAYIMPSSGFFFGGTGSQSASLMDFLPSRHAADRLIKAYFTAVHPICQIVHRPTFEKEYDAFWDEVGLGIEPPNSVQTIVFAAMFSGVVSMDESVLIRDFGRGKTELQDNFKLGTETALIKANFLRTTKMETLQAFVMYLIPLCRSELSRAHSVLLGSAIRMAECMGLHRDGETYGMNPLETHVRRLVWYQLCFLDIRCCEAQGPRPQIRRDEFDTRIPLNVDNVDLHATGKPPANADRWTDSTLTLIRFEVNEMMRTIWVDRPRIERRKISLTAVLSKIETFRANMARKYDHLMDDRIPIQKCAKIIKALLISRLHVMVLHRYHSSVGASMPDRLRNILLASGTTSLETAVALDTYPELRPWQWYSGALQQYHTAFLLLTEVFYYPQRKEADRIWACLDYIFETNRAEGRRDKAIKVLAEIQQKAAAYQSMRGMRAPVSMLKSVGERAADAKGKQQQNPVSPVGPEGQPGQTPTKLYRHGLTGVPGPSEGRMPIRNMVFAGISDNQALWALPNPMQGDSPEGNSETASISGQPNNVGLSIGPDELMVDFDWEQFDAMFPPELKAGFEVPGYPFQGVGIYGQNP